MLIAPDSSLRRVPVGLDRRQQIVLDGLRISADVIDLCFRRLTAALRLLPIQPADTAERVELACSANLDAWTIVDHVHRFSELLRQMPMVKQNLPQFQLLFRAATEAEQMRNYIQHVRNEINALSSSGQSVWGSLTWALKQDFDAGRRTKYSLSVGTFYEGNFAAVGAFPETVTKDVDFIEIHAGSRSFELTTLLTHVERVIRSFEEGVEAQAGGRPRHGSDFLAILTMQPAE
jgi:hypothetical protein